jgi:hypothetical protein
MRDLHVVARSGNTKTGDIPVTYRPMRTCEPTCPFLPSKDSGGCYGTGRIFAMAEKLTGERSADDVDATLAKRNPAARYMRDRVVGDVIDVDADGSVTVDVEYIEAVADAAARNDLTAFGYSHAWPRFTPEDVARMAASGYVMNASCETPADVDAALAMGLPATIANDDIAEGTMIGGGRVVTCPAQTRDDVDCASCGLCAKPQRKAVVRFLIHGTAQRKARAAVSARMEE